MDSPCENFGESISKLPVFIGDGSSTNVANEHEQSDERTKRSVQGNKNEEGSPTFFQPHHPGIFSQSFSWSHCVVSFFFSPPAFR